MDKMDLMDRMVWWIRIDQENGKIDKIDKIAKTAKIDKFDKTSKIDNVL